MFKRYVKVTGSPRERGIAIGKELKSEIMANYKNQVRYYKGKEDYDYAEWEEMSKRYLPMIEKWAPDVLEELKGMAEGAEMEFEKIIALTTAYEKSFDRNWISDKCTSFFVTGAASKGGKTIAAQTNDENLLEWRHEL
ncbi:C45 family autoproteolytic acyltransferase/hydrolase, partial [Tyzzerella sp. OttesenSCG-928-J15]|nr:C45 family autoproteolytic acyltransferase/hydrolase [Tyzzerella sp. OttesenSCG-928-J15]